MAPQRVARLLLLAQLTQALRVTRRSLAGAAGCNPTAPQLQTPSARPEVRHEPARLHAHASGLQIKDVKEGTGAAAAAGDRVVYEWEGYTIGYLEGPSRRKLV